MPLKYIHTVNHSEYSLHYMRKLPALLRGGGFEKAARCFFSLIHRCGIFGNNLLIMPYLELCVTPLCTLRCRKCANFMPLYSHGSHYSVETVLQPFDKVMSSIDSVLWFRILGGEPFLHPDLDIIIRHCSSNKKIEHVEIVTNGTVLPSKDMMRTLKETKSKIYISNYGYASCRKDLLIRELEKNNIPYKFNEILEWEDMGDGQRFEYSNKQVRDVYAACTNICKTIVQGELHVCPRSAHGTGLGIIAKKIGNYVDVTEENSSTLRAAIRALYDVECIEACYHCIGPNREVIKAGEQFTRKSS